MSTPGFNPHRPGWSYGPGKPTPGVSDNVRTVGLMAALLTAGGVTQDDPDRAVDLAIGLFERACARREDIEATAKFAGTDGSASRP